MKPRNKRIVFVLIALLSVGAASALINKAMQGNLNYLYTPEEVLLGKPPKDQVFRLGGLVKKGSLTRSKTKMEARFVVRDNHHNEITVVTDKILPDLFQEGKSQISRGKMGDDGLFHAIEVLAKHDSEYMPKELKDKLKKEHEVAVPVKTSASVENMGDK